MCIVLIQLFYIYFGVFVNDFYVIEWVYRKTFKTYRYNKFE